MPNLTEAELNRMRMVDIVEHNVREAVRAGKTLPLEVSVVLQLLDEARANRDRLAAQVQRIRDLATPCTGGPPSSYDKVHAAEILAVLGGGEQPASAPLTGAQCEVLVTYVQQAVDAGRAGTAVDDLTARGIVAHYLAALTGGEQR